MRKVRHSTHRRMTSIVGASAIAALALTACTATAPPDGPLPEPTSADCTSMDTVSFGMISPSAGYWLPLYADAVGLWADNCIDLDIVAIANAANLLTAVTTNDLQLTAVPSANGFAAIESGMDLVAVAANQPVNDATFVGAPHIQMPSDLRGKVIGTASLTSTSTLAMVEILSAAGLNEGDYEIVAGGGSAERLAALSSGAFDATWLLSPGDFQLLDEGYSDLGTIGEAFANDIYSSVFVSPAWAAENEELLVRVLSVWAAASEAFHDATNRADFERVLVDDVGATPDIAVRTYDRYQKLGAIAPNGNIEVEQVYNVFELMVKLETLTGIPADASKFVDMSYWAQATGGQAPNFVKP